MDQGAYFIKHRWSWCDYCGPSVDCGKCGNPSCNAGRGTLPDGSPCDACDSAYELMINGVVPQDLAERHALWEANELYPNGVGEQAA